VNSSPPERVAGYPDLALPRNPVEGVPGETSPGLDSQQLALALGNPQAHRRTTVKAGRQAIPKGRGAALTGRSDQLAAVTEWPSGSLPLLSPSEEILT